MLLITSTISGWATDGMRPKLSVVLAVPHQT